MGKYYFYEQDDWECTTIEFIKDMISANGLIEKEVYKANRMIGQGVFFCTKHRECGEVGESCGINKCDDYKPRNGKSGKCKNSGYCYEVGEKILIKI
jgi:hypothetical protein